MAAFNGSGTFVRSYNWTNDAANGIDILPDRFDTEMNGIATGLSTCILKDGTQTVTADIPWNSKKITGLGIPAVGDNTATAITASFLNLTVAPPQGRLTLTSGVPVLTTTVSAATTVIYALDRGNYIPIRSGSGFAPWSFTELSNILANSATGNAGPAAGASSQVYDLYVWNNAGTLTLTRSPSWASGSGGSNTARGTGAGGSAQTRVLGILTNTVDIVNGPTAGNGTYVGTIMTDAGGATVTWNLGGSASGGTAAVLGVWNAYNRRVVAATVIDIGAPYTYTSATIRQARASNGNQVTFISGLSEDYSQSFYCQQGSTTIGIASFCKWGIGLDSTTTFISQPYLLYNNSSATGSASAGGVYFNVTPQLGAHVLYANEASDGSDANTINGGSKGTLGFNFNM